MSTNRRRYRSALYLLPNIDATDCSSALRLTARIMHTSGTSNTKRACSSRRIAYLGWQRSSSSTNT